MPKITEYPSITTIDANTILLADGNSGTGTILATDLASYVLEEYAGSTLAGSSQSVQDALGILSKSVIGLGSNINLDEMRTPESCGIYWLNLADANVGGTKPGTAGQGILVVKRQSSTLYRQVYIPVTSGTDYKGRYYNYSDNTWHDWGYIPMGTAINTVYGPTTIKTLESTDDLLSIAVGHYRISGVIPVNAPDNALKYGFLTVMNRGASGYTYYEYAVGNSDGNEFRQYRGWKAGSSAASIVWANGEGYSLDGGTLVESGFNFDTALTVGNYYIPTTALADASTGTKPIAHPIGFLKVMKVRASANYTTQIFYLYDALGAPYTRNYVASTGTWSDWERVPTRAEMDGADRLYLGPNDISIPNNADLNDYRTAGTYVIGTSSQIQTMANVPVSSYGGRLDVKYILKTNTADTDSSKRLFQIFTGNHSSYPVFIRFFNGSIWSDWKKMPNRDEVDTLSSKLTVNGVLRLSDSASVKPLTLTVPSISRHLLILTGPYVSRGHGVYTVSCNASGNCYAFLIGGGDDMPTKVSGTGNTLTITSTSESDALVAVADLVISGNQMTLAQ